MTLSLSSPLTFFPSPWMWTEIDAMFPSPWMWTGSDAMFPSPSHQFKQAEIFLSLFSRFFFIADLSYIFL
jgi:hypothetical protein